MNVKLIIIYECHSDCIPVFLSEETEKSFKLSTKKQKGTSTWVV